MKKTVLIDGHSLLYTNYHATLDSRIYGAKTEEEKQKYYDKLLKTSDGKYINAVFGMARSINNMMDKIKPDYVAIAWDKSRKTTFRKKMYPEYKGHRPKTDKPLKEQIKTAQEFFDSIGIKQYQEDEFEADDIVGTLAKNIGGSVYVWSKDQDLLQLVDNNIRMWLITQKKKQKEMMEEMGYDKEIIKNAHVPSSAFEHTPLTINHFYGLNPIQIIDLKAIEGDTSDNIPGIKGVGEKTIIPLLQEFETIENIYDFIDGSTLKENKTLFKELGIRSPMNKLMEKIDYDDLIFLVSNCISNLKESNERGQYNEILGINTNAISDVEINNHFINLDKKEKKRIFKKIKKVSKKTNSDIYEIVCKHGSYVKGQAHKDSILFKKLTTIRTDIPKYKEIDKKEIQHSFHENKIKVFKEYEFKSLL